MLNTVTVQFCVLIYCMNFFLKDALFLFDKYAVSFGMVISIVSSPTRRTYFK